MTAENARCEGDLGQQVLSWKVGCADTSDYGPFPSFPVYWYVPQHSRDCPTIRLDEPPPYYWAGSPAARAVILTTVLGHLFQLVPGSISEVLSIARGGDRPPEDQILAYDKLMLVLAQAEEDFTVFWVYTLAGFTGWPPEDVLSTLKDMSASRQEHTMLVVEKASAHGGWEHEA